MSNATTRRCFECNELLPERAKKNQKYCKQQCQRRAAVRRHRLKKHPKEAEQQHLIDDLKRQLDDSIIANRKLQERLDTAQRKSRNLYKSLQRAEHQIEVAANEQAERTRSVRDQLATANSEVATLRRNWSRRAAAATDSQEVTELRDRLAAVTHRYDSLVAKYRELSEAARYAATERKHLQGIVRQWDAMCVRLYKATGGRPKRDADKKVLATWSRFRELVRK